MSVETREFLLTAQLRADALEIWIDAGWLAPRVNGQGRHFSEVDLARVHLIHDLQDLGVNDDAVPAARLAARAARGSFLSGGAVRNGQTPSCFRR